MTQPKHTPAPWRVSKNGNWVIDANDDCVCKVTEITEKVETSKTNARLIAAAPELLENLKAIVCLIEQSGGVAFASDGALSKAHAAIAKANSGGFDADKFAEHVEPHLTPEQE